MAILIYFLLTGGLGAALILARNRVLNEAASVLFPLLQVGLCLYGYSHLGEKDSRFFQFDAMGILLTGVFALLSIPAAWHCRLYLARNRQDHRSEGQFYTALLLLGACMNGVYLSEHLGLLWACMEGTTLCMAVLIYYERGPLSLEATWKYVFVSSLGIAIALAGVLFLSVAASGAGLSDLGFTELGLAAPLMETLWLKVAFVLVLVGFSAKWAVFPLHAVGIGAKGVAPYPIAALMSSCVANVGFVGVFRLFAVISQTESLPWARNLMLMVGMASIAVAAIQMLRVENFKRMFAFSSTEHMGIVALGLAAGGIGYYAAVLHVVLHSLAKANLFFQIGQAGHAYGSFAIRDTGNLMKINPIAAIGMALAFIVVTAMPPSGLFVSELMIFQAMLADRPVLFTVLALGLLSVIIYTLGKNIMHLLFHSSPSIPEERKGLKSNQLESLLQFPLLGLVVYLGFFPPEFFRELILQIVSILK